MSDGLRCTSPILRAGDKYAEAIRIKPDFHEAFNNWGAALSAQANASTGDAAIALITQAGDKYAESESISPGSAAYNQACLSALCGRTEECRSWLALAKQHKTLPTATHIKSDSDLEAVRGEVWFSEFL